MLYSDLCIRIVTEVVFYQHCLDFYYTLTAAFSNEGPLDVVPNSAISALSPAHVALCRLLLSGRAKATFLHLFSMLDGKSAPTWLSSEPHPHLLFADAAIRPPPVCPRAFIIGAEV